MRFKDIINFINGRIAISFEAFTVCVYLPTEIEWIKENIDWVLDLYIEEIDTTEDMTDIILSEKRRE